MLIDSQPRPAWCDVRRTDSPDFRASPDHRAASRLLVNPTAARVLCPIDRPKYLYAPGPRRPGANATTR